MHLKPAQFIGTSISEESKKLLYPWSKNFKKIEVLEKVVYMTQSGEEIVMFNAKCFKPNNSVQYRKVWVNLTAKTIKSELNNG